MFARKRRPRRYTSVWYIIALYVILLVVSLIIKICSKFDIGDILTIMAIGIATYYGDRQLNNWKEIQYKKSWRTDIISAAENSRLYGVENGFIVKESNDKLWNIAVAWKTIHKVPLSPNVSRRKTMKDYNFCIFFRVFSSKKDYKIIMSDYESKDKFPSSTWWDYYTMISCIDGEYSGGLSGNYNIDRKSSSGLEEMSDVDFDYAKQVIGKIHTFDYRIMENCKYLGEKYNIKYIVVNSDEKSIIVQPVE